MRSLIVPLSLLTFVVARLESAEPFTTYCLVWESLDLAGENTISLPVFNEPVSLSHDGKLMASHPQNFCFVDGLTFEFKCHQRPYPYNGFDVVSVETSTQLSADGETTWMACGPSPGQDYAIISGARPDHTGCLEGVIHVTSGSDCAGHRRTLSTITVPKSRVDRPRGLLRSRQAPAAVPSCTVSDTSPSLAPVYVYNGAANQTDFLASTDRTAHITDTSSAVFGFSVPGDFPPSGFVSASSLCAVQFRFPYCTDLPEGYPCYTYSGLEQEVLNNSGMNVSRVANFGNVTDYSEAGFVAPTPGTNKTIATFECGTNTSGIPGDLMWLAESTNGFQLEFLQGGGESGFDSGIGTWIVACA